MRNGTSIQFRKKVAFSFFLPFIFYGHSNHWQNICHLLETLSQTWISELCLWARLWSNENCNKKDERLCSPRFNLIISIKIFLIETAINDHSLFSSFFLLWMRPLRAQLTLDDSGRWGLKLRHWKRKYNSLLFFKQDQFWLKFLHSFTLFFGQMNAS